MKARTWQVGVVLLLTLMLTALAGTAQGVAPKGIIATPPPSSALEVSVWVDQGAYALGDSITIHYSVNKQAYIYIWDITPDGVANQIFPNSFPGGSNNYVSAGDHTVPGSWTIAPPVGTEYLQILATTTQVNPFSYFTTDPESFQSQIQAQILGVLPASEMAWNFTSFQIVSGSLPSYGTLDIRSVPAGASIYLDGVYAGYTPRTLFVQQGFHTVTIAKSGYQSYESAIFVLGGRTRTINPTLVGTAPANQRPNPAFTYSPSQPNVGEWVQFDATASFDPDGTIATYSWTFGDGSTGTGSTIWHRFTSAGNFTVALSVTDNQGASAQVSEVVQVGPTNQSPVAAFSFSPTNPTPGSWVQFDGSGSYDPDGSIATYAWDFGDGTTNSGATVWHRFTSGGSYNVTLTVTDNEGAQDVVSKTVPVAAQNMQPVAAFTVSPTAPTVNEWVRFDGTSSSDSDGSIATYRWTFGDGSPAVTGNVVYHQFTAAGSYSATLTVTDNLGATNSATKTVQVGTPQQAPVAAFTVSPASPTVGTAITLNATSSYDPDGTIVSYQWDLNGDGVTDSTGPIGQVSYSNPGTATVRLTVTDNTGLTGSTTKSIVISPATTPGIPGAPSMGSVPGIFVWGTDRWHITVNAGAGWMTSRNYRIELRTDGGFQNIDQSTSGVAALGLVPTPTTGQKTLIFEGSVQNGSVDHTFRLNGATSMWLSLKLDVNGDGVLDESTNFVYLRQSMVHPPANPFVVGLPSGSSAELLPSLNFRIGTAVTYTETTRFVFWSTTIGTLESQ